MKPSTLLDFSLSAILHPQILCRKLTYLFLLSHMRSRSSLLGHILGSHPEIAGYSEGLREYTSRKCFLRFRYHTWKEARWRKPNYVLDKILHNQFSPSEACLNEFPIKCIIFIRPPLETIRSIVALSNRMPELGLAQHDKATLYYCQRLEELVHISQLLSCTQWMYFDSVDLIEKTESLLKKIKIFLDLKVSLSSNYKTFPNTTVKGYGDPSENIRAGKILNLDPFRYDEIELENSLIQQSDKIYRDACKHFKSKELILSQ